MKIRDLYAQYDIMPQLATHQLRVAGIAKIITDPWDDHSLARECVTTCLLHDMGNIVKFAGLTDPHWIAIQKKYVDLYGADAHAATSGILHEQGLTQYIDYLEEEGKIYAKNESQPDFVHVSRPALLVLYTDLRVSITGVSTLRERISDLERRYGGKRIESIWGYTLEEYVQTLTPASVTRITEKDVAPLFDELLDYQI